MATNNYRVLFNFIFFDQLNSKSTLLKKLYIKKFALIDELNLQFDKGFSVISGESGAGKSIILDALSLVLGARTDSSKLKRDEKCIIEVVFDLSNLKLKSYFENNDLDYEEQSIFRREILPSSKSRTFVNDTPVSLNQLKEVGSKIIVIHSQHHSLELKSMDAQLNFLDIFADNQMLLSQYQHFYHRWRKQKKHLQELRDTKDDFIRNLEFDKFQLKELSEVDFENVHWEQLKEEFELISNSESLKQMLSSVISLIGESGASEQIRQGQLQLSDKLPLSQSLVKQKTRLQNIYHELNDVSYELSKCYDSLELDESKRLQMEELIDNLNSLMYKHRVDDISGLVELKAEIEGRVNMQENMDDQIKDAEEMLDELEMSLNEKALALHNNRKTAGKQFAFKIVDGLNSLKMDKVELIFQLEEQEEFDRYGKDKLQLLMSSDGKQNFSPLSKVASGGELSRIMLVVKLILSQKTVLPSMIFDEVDSGVSGDVARKMGEMLKIMSMKMQLICISHIPQVASLADKHYQVSKSKNNNEVISKVRQLNDDERIVEIAKMLSGTEISDQALENAKVLMST